MEIIEMSEEEEKSIFSWKGLKATIHA